MDVLLEDAWIATCSLEIVFWGAGKHHFLSTIRSDQWSLGFGDGYLCVHQPPSFSHICPASLSLFPNHELQLLRVH